MAAEVATIRAQVAGATASQLRGLKDVVKDTLFKQAQSVRAVVKTAAR